MRLFRTGLLALSALLGGCRGCDEAAQEQGAKTVVVRGSDTMIVLAQRWAEAYRRERPQIRLQVSGGGSGTGLAALENGTTDVATASRAITSAERARIRQQRGAEVEEARVCLDAIAIYVHPSNPIGHLTIAQLTALFRGHVRSWRELGGSDRRVVLYSRESSSGTYAYFKERVLANYDFAAEAQSLPGTAAVVQAVALDPGGIGYGGIAREVGVRVVPIAPADGGEAAHPTAQAAQSGAYPLARPLYAYHVAPRGGEVEQFVRWLGSPAARELALGAGFYPIVEGS
ncbi:MAG: phosphate ABC transporter substrate-binding protein [Polyangiaceae bacterium]|nr:phosphate ABC transporter substrate-binding protein [Polyangiaceae bacterium]